jgi:hypothetical protein
VFQSRLLQGTIFSMNDCWLSSECHLSTCCASWEPPQMLQVLASLSGRTHIQDPSDMSTPVWCTWHSVFVEGEEQSKIIQRFNQFRSSEAPSLSRHDYDQRWWFSTTPHGTSVGYAAAREASSKHALRASVQGIKPHLRADPKELHGAENWRNKGI